jgi:hypothetical protein
VECLSFIVEGNRLVRRHGSLSALDHEVRPGLKPDGCFDIPPTPDVASRETLPTKHPPVPVEGAGGDATGAAGTRSNVYWMSLDVGGCRWMSVRYCINSLH